MPINSHTMEPAAMRKRDAENHIGRDKAAGDARLQERRDMMRAVQAREQKEKELEKDGPEK